MRYILLLKASPSSEAGDMPGPDLIEAMGAFNQQMVDAGVMVDGAGLQASSKGVRVHLKTDGERTVTEGPFPDVGSLISGYWNLDVKSLAEAIEWVKRCPTPHPGYDCEIEIRKVFEAGDFGPEIEASEDALREQIARQKA